MGKEKFLLLISDNGLPYLSVYVGFTLSVSTRSKRLCGSDVRAPAPVAIILPRGARFHRLCVSCLSVNEYKLGHQFALFTASFESLLNVRLFLHCVINLLAYLYRSNIFPFLFMLFVSNEICG